VRLLPADPGHRLIVFCDGAARGNPGPAGIGAAIFSESGDLLAEVSEGIGIATNNVAEYMAAIAGLERCRDLGADEVTVRADSKLIVEQLSGRWRVKQPTLIRLHGEARALMKAFRRVRFEHVPRERNKVADKLANRGVDAWLRRQGAGLTPDVPTPDLFG
jgi:probable phosphoglycerate mutase